MALKNKLYVVVLFVLYVVASYVSITLTTSLNLATSLLLENNIFVIISLFVIIFLIGVFLTLFNKVETKFVVQLFVVYLLNIIAIMFFYDLTILNITFAYILTSQFIIGINNFEYDDLNFDILQFISLTILILLFFGGLFNFTLMLITAGIILYIINNKKISINKFSILFYVLMIVLFIIKQYI